MTRVRGRPRGSAPLWLAFAAVHLWLTALGVVVVPAEAFWDLDLYRYWMYLALEEGQWPVLDEPWVYPAGALLPMLLPAVGTTVSTPGYALGWCLVVTAVDAVALRSLLRSGRPAARTGAWWWLGFLLLLGPVAIGRLDAIIAPLMVVALVLGVRSARGGAVASAVLTTGAWIKVAPGALVLTLAAVARRPLREVVAPAAAVCAVVALVVGTGGGIGRLLSFLDTQEGRGLQAESVVATPWVVAALGTPVEAGGGDASGGAARVAGVPRIELDETLATYEVHGPGTVAAAQVLDVVLPAAVLAVGVLLLLARRRGTAEAALLPAALTLMTVLIVTNKVGSPQFLTWLAAPVAVLLAGDEPGRRARWVRVVTAVTLVAAGLTQVVFPWGYLSFVSGDPAVTAVLVLRNVLLVVLLVTAGRALVRTAFVGTTARPPTVTGAAHA